MGRGIAQTLSLNNYNVHIFDISDDLLSQNNEKIKTNLNKLCSRDKITPSSVKSALSNISLHLDIGDAMKKCDLVIEAVPENLGLKIKVLQDSDKYSDDSTIFVSNTSGLPITLMAESISRPERLLGMHWFNPPYLMKLIEIIKCKYTDDDVFNIIINLVKQLGKSPIIVKKDIRGFIANRVYRSIRYESFINILNGVFTPSEIDSAFRYKCGFPLGPIELSDFTGSIDIETQETLTIDSVRKKIPTWEPHDSYLMFRSHSLILAKKYYDSGLLGVKTGKGFYNYPSPGNWVKINLEEQLGDSVDPKSIIAPASNALDACSPDESKTSNSLLSKFLLIKLDFSFNSSLTSAIAETITIISLPSLNLFLIILATFLIFSIVPTDVPPNFSTNLFMIKYLIYFI